jgi:hypothetical protein
MIGGEMEPQGKIKVVGVEDTRPDNRLAVYVRVLCEDEAGNKFYFETASFYFDLKPLTEQSK